MPKASQTTVGETAEIAALTEALREAQDQLATTQFHLEERLSGLDLMADSVGWTDVTGVSNDDGPTLDQLKKRSKQIRSAVALSPHLGQGLRLRAERVWAEPITYRGVPGLNGEATGRGIADVGSRVNDPLNHQYVFGPSARYEREAALYSDGMYFLLGEDSSRRLAAIPLSEISADYRNPERASEIWAYRRSWYDYSNGTINPTERVEWVFTDLFKDKQTESIKYNGKTEPVATGKTLIDGSVNSQVGWAYGFPDAGAVIEWARIYSEFMKSGKSMSDAMARIWAQVKKDVASGVPSAAARVAGMSGFGNIQVGAGTEFAPLSTAGRSYDFAPGLHLLAIVAAGLGVSVVALSSNPGAAGASYGAAQVLSLPERLSTQFRRDWHVQYDVRVLRYLGAKKPEAYWPPLVDGAELLRLSQAAQLAWNSGLYSPEEAKEQFEHARNNYSDVDPVPDGVLLPNNEASWERSDIDPKDGPATSTTQAPGQGQSTGIGDNPGGSNDTRTDTIT